jgi:DNA (cytosine-5)-methyltransferase 1
VDYPVISLFSGAMGLDLGLEQAGLRVAVAQDFDPWCVATVRANGRKIVAGDIRQLLAADPDCQFLLEPAHLTPSRVFAVVGGPPCQPFSTAGKRLSTADPRGSLFAQFCQVVEQLHPRFFVMENVKGLVSAPLRGACDSARAGNPSRGKGSALEEVLDSFSRLGYTLKYGVLDAVHFGVPEFRERLIIIGSRDHEPIFLPMPTHFQQHQDNKYRWHTLRWAIEDLEANPGPCGRFSQERLDILKQVPMGGNWRSLPNSLQKQAMGGAFESGGGKVGFYRRLNYNEPCPTLVTSPVQKATMLCHPCLDRPLSVHEYARIQQFPDDWAFRGTVSECYRQIGNAVPLGLGRVIGQTLRSIAAGNAVIATKRTRGTSVHDELGRLQTATHASEGTRLNERKE